MERREFIALLGVAATMMPLETRAETLHAATAKGDRVASDPLAGTWSFASSINTRKDGTTFDRWGDDAKGVFMFNSGHYAQIIVGSESRVFGSKVFCAFGDYTFDQAAKRLVTRITACSVSKISGTEQTRAVLLLTADEFKYSNPATATGAMAEVLWKRIG